ncbi:MAG: hypothetical protein ACK4NW_10870 [Roseinatronobacter sp.]
MMEYKDNLLNEDFSLILDSYRHSCSADKHHDQVGRELLKTAKSVFDLAGYHRCLAIFARYAGSAGERFDLAIGFIHFLSGNFEAAHRTLRDCPISVASIQGVEALAVSAIMVGDRDLAISVLSAYFSGKAIKINDGGSLGRAELVLLKYLYRISPADFEQKVRAQISEDTLQRIEDFDTLFLLANSAATLQNCLSQRLIGEQQFAPVADGLLSGFLSPSEAEGDRVLVSIAYFLKHFVPADLSEVVTCLGARRVDDGSIHRIFASTNFGCFVIEVTTKVIVYREVDGEFWTVRVGGTADAKKIAQEGKIWRTIFSDGFDGLCWNTCFVLPHRVRLGEFFERVGSIVQAAEIGMFRENWTAYLPDSTNFIELDKGLHPAAWEKTKAILSDRLPQGVNVVTKFKSLIGVLSFNSFSRALAYKVAPSESGDDASCFRIFFSFEFEKRQFIDQIRYAMYTIEAALRLSGCKKVVVYNNGLTDTIKKPGLSGELRRYETDFLASLRSIPGVEVIDLFGLDSGQKFTACSVLDMYVAPMGAASAHAAFLGIPGLAFGNRFMHRATLHRNPEQITIPVSLTTEVKDVVGHKGNFGGSVSYAVEFDVFRRYVEAVIRDAVARRSA